MKRTYIQVKKLYELLGGMTNSMIFAKVYKSVNSSNPIFEATLHSSDLSAAFGDYFVFVIMSDVDQNNHPRIKTLICIDRPDGEWQEV